MEEIAIPSFKLWKSHLCMKFIFWLPVLSNSILVNWSGTWWYKKCTRKWIWEFRQLKRRFLCFAKKVHVLVENGTSFYIENLGAHFSIFHDFRNWASFSHHFWIIQMKLQSSITIGIITIIKIKSSLCV